MDYLQAAQVVALILATVAIVVAATRVVAHAWRGREADGQHLAVVLLSRETLRQHERGEDLDPALQQRLTALQVDEPRPSSSREDLDLRLAPAYFVGAFLLQWVIARLMGQSVSLWLLAGSAWLATAAGICVAHLLHVRGVGRGRRDGTAYAFVALLAVLSVLTQGT